MNVTTTTVLATAAPTSRVAAIVIVTLAALVVLIASVITFFLRHRVRSGVEGDVRQGECHVRFAQLMRNIWHVARTGRPPNGAYEPVPANFPRDSGID